MSATTTTDLWRVSHVDLAEAIRSKQISSQEVIEAHLRRIEAVNPSVNAVTVLLGEQAVEAAKAGDRAIVAGRDLPSLHGVPFTVKETIDLAGTPTSQGLKVLAGAYPGVDAPVLERLKAAGAIPSGCGACSTCPPGRPVAHLGATFSDLRPYIGLIEGWQIGRTESVGHPEPSRVSCTPSRLGRMARCQASGTRTRRTRPYGWSVITSGTTSRSNGVSRRTFYRWRERGVGPPSLTLPNGEIRIRRSDFLSWLRHLEKRQHEVA